MRALRTAMHVELRKALASRVLRTTTVLLVAGIATLAGTLVAAARAGNEQITAQLGSLAGQTGWDLLGSTTAQITAAGSLLAFGVALSWTFGREFADGTITSLFGLPVSRSTIALAKLLVHVLWVTLVAAGLTALVLAAGLALGLGAVDGSVLDQLVRQFTLTFLTGLIAIPATWAATLGRGLLPGIATTLAILITAQVSVIVSPDLASWLPFSAPALWALQSETVHGWQLATVAIIPIAFGMLTTIASRRLQLDH